MAKQGALKRTLHVLASLFVPLIMVGFLLLAVLLAAIEGLRGRVKKPPKRRPQNLGGCRPTANG